MKTFIQALIATFLFIALTPHLNAGNFDDGHTAAQEGDFQKAYQLWLRDAEKGDPFAQYNLGIMYSKGEGIPQNLSEAFKWYHMAAVQGFAQARYNLGVMYENGEGVTQDYKEAMKWYHMAAQQGFAPAQFNMGVMYFKGNGVPQSYEDAYAWWLVAAENENDKARKNMELAQDKILSADQVDRGKQIAQKIKSRIRK